MKKTVREIPPTLGYELPLEYFISTPYPLLLERIMDQSSKLRVSEISTSDIESLKKRIKKKKVDSYIENVVVTGVDGGSNGKPCEGIYVGIASALGYTSPLMELTDSDPITDGSIILIDADEPEQWLSLFERYLTMKVAVNTVAQKRPQWLLVDGGLILRPSYIKHVEGSEEIYDYDENYHKVGSYVNRLDLCLKEIIRLLDTCRRMGTKVIGIVKRSTSRIISKKIRSKKRHRDVVLLDRFLDVGEYTEPVDAGENENKTLAMYREIAKRDIDIKVSYIKTTAIKGPVRVEVPSWVDMDEAMRLVMADSDPVMGIPAHITRADTLVRIPKDTFKSVFSRILWNNPGAVGIMRPQRGEEFELREGE